MTEDQVSKRDYLLDTIKGIAIILVVLGHCIQFGSGMEYFAGGLFWDNLIYRGIYSFHMPLFAIVSGYLMFASIKRRSFLSFCKKQLTYIGIPLVSWGIIRWSVSLMLSKESLFQIMGGGKHLIVSLYSEIMVGLWFLRVLLVCSIVIATVTCYVNRKYQLVTFIFIWLVSLFIPDIYKYNRAVFLFPYFVFGYFVSENKNRLRDLRKVKSLLNSWYFIGITTLLFLLSLMFFKSEYIYAFRSQATYLFQSGFSFTSVSKQMFVNCYRWIVGFLGSAAVILLCRKLFGHRFNLFSSVGLHTFSIYIMSDALNSTVLLRISACFHYSFGLCVLESTILIILLIAISRLVRMSHFWGRVLLGNR